MTRAPLVLVVSEDEWAARSLGSILAPRGYAVLRAYTAKQALALGTSANPDAVFVHDSIPDLSVDAICRALVEREVVSRATPIIVLAPPHTSREEKLQALSSGAWEVVQVPMDADELLLRLERFVQAKLESDRTQTEAVVDHLTGLYSREGVVQRVREVGAAAERFGRPLACIVIGAGQDAGEIPPEELVAFAHRLRQATRRSDVLARIGASDFAVIAPDTPPEGARILTDRLREEALAGPGMQGVRALRAGYHAIAEPTGTIDPLDLMQRATTAARAVPG